MFGFVENISSEFVVIAVLGLIFFIDPCSLLINITALGYFTKDFEKKRRFILHSIFFALGRFITLALLGVVSFVLLKTTSSIFYIEKWIGIIGDTWIIPLLLILGILLVFSDKISWLRFSINTNNLSKKQTHLTTSFLFGSLFSLTFCPTNILILFGMILPLAIKSTLGVIIPISFAIATTIPLIIIFLLLLYSISKLDAFYDFLRKSNKTIVKVMGIMFILIAVYMIVSHFLLEQKHPTAV